MDAKKHDVLRHGDRDQGRGTACRHKKECNSTQRHKAMIYKQTIGLKKISEELTPKPVGVTNCKESLGMS